MRKLSMVVALATIFSLVVAGPALAQLVVNLGPGNNTYNERRCPPNGDETVSGLAGDDVLRLQVCGDTANEPDATDSDADVGNGNRGKDRVRVDVGDMDLGTTLNVDDPPEGPGGGTGPEEDVGDTLADSCETIIYVEGEFYHQT